MGKILIFSGVRGDTRRYRSLHLYEQLSLAGADCVLSHLTDPRLLEHARSASAAVLHRVALDSYVEKVLHFLRSRGALIVLDADDFLYDPSIMRWIDSPDFQDTVRARLYREEIMRHRAGLDRCDAITASTEFLGEMLGSFGKPVRTHRNAYNLDMLRLSNLAYQNRQQQTDRVVIGYASGTRTHDQDFAMIKPVLAALMERYPMIELWLMGPISAGEDWGGLQERVRSFPLVAWRDLPHRLAMLDINLAPLLPESPFNQAKSEIKYMEAGLVRVPTVASITDAFRYAIQHGRNGFLAGSPDEWRLALERLIEHPAERQAMGEAAYQDVVSRYDPAARGVSYLQFLDDFSVQFNKPPLKFCSGEALTPGTEFQNSLFAAEHEQHPTMVDLARYSIRNRGVGTLLGQAWVFFRRKLAPIFPFRSAGG